MTTPENFAGNTQGDPEWEEYMHTADRGLEVRVPVKAGPHDVGVSFVRRLVGARRRSAAAANRLRAHDERVVLRLSGGEDRVDRRTVQRRRPGRRRRRAARCSCARPKDASEAEERRARARFFRRSRTRAYRRPVTEAEIAGAARLLPGRPHGRQDFDAGIQRGLERILAAPSFLFRIERQPAGSLRTAYRVSDLDLASKLSFFLWSSIPDEELLMRRSAAS